MQLQPGGHRAASGERLVDHLIPASASKDKAVAGWAVEGLPALGMVPAEQDLRWLQVAPALDWHCLPARPGVHC